MALLFLFKAAPFKALKVIGILCCMAGNALTLGNDHQKGQRAELDGDLLCLLAAVLYAVYTTLLSRLVKPDFSMQVLFGTIGILILVLAAPLAFGLRHQAFRRMSPEIFGLLIFNGLFATCIASVKDERALRITCSRSSLGPKPCSGRRQRPPPSACRSRSHSAPCHGLWILKG